MRIGNGAQASRRLAILVSACAVLGAVVPSTTAGAAASIVKLAAVTTVHFGPSTGSMVVELPKTVTFGGQCDPEPQVTARGTADTAVVALVPLGVKSPTPNFFGKLPRREGGHSFSSMCGDGSQLAAGKYKLVTLSSGGSMSLVLRLPGLAGGVSLSPAIARAPAKLVRLPLLEPYSATTGATSYAGTGRLAGKGFVMVVGWNRVAGDAATTNGDCEVSEPESTQLPLAATEAPGCPLGSGGMSVPTVSGASENFWIGGESNVGGGVYAAGYFVMSSVAPTSAGAIAMWVPFSA